MKIFQFSIALLVLILFASGSFALDLIKRRDLVLPRTALGNFTLSGMTRDEVRGLLREKLKIFNETKFPIAARGEVQEATYMDLNAALNESELLKEIPFAHYFSNFEIVLLSFFGNRVMPKIKLEKTELLRLVHEKFPKLPKARNAHFARRGNTFVIEEGEKGVKPLLDLLLQEIKQNAMFLEHHPLFIEFEESSPTLSAAVLRPYEKEIRKIFPSKIKLIYEKQQWEADFEKHPEWIEVDQKAYAIDEKSLPFQLQWDALSFAQFIDESIVKKLEQAPEDVRIFRDAEGKIQFDGRGNEGKAVEQERLMTRVNNAIADGQKEVLIPLAVVPPKVEVSPDLQAAGIRELIAVGHTKYAGSPPNRRHNIGVGVRRYHGTMIPPGETFSFGDHLGPVDASTGYKKELVIKPEGTIPEFGGGLCQVSTTMYRAAIYAGLPIVERTPHSYVVTYYSQVGGHGLDATVYPPSRDFKFKNDTPGHILVQSYVEEETSSAFFKFYGTSDGRSVALDGPYISNRREPPAEPVLVPDKNLPVGEKKQVEKPHTGFDTVWYRTITRGPAETKEKIESHYKAVPAKFLVGGQVTAEGENRGLTEGSNPFE